VTRPQVICNDLKIVAGFRKINHFVTFDTSNIYSWSNAFYSTNQPYSEYSIRITWNICIETYVLLWQHSKAFYSIYFTRDKVVDFPKFSYNYWLHLVYNLYPRYILYGIVIVGLPYAACIWSIYSNHL